MLRAYNRASFFGSPFPTPRMNIGPYTYDATFVLVDAMKRANSTDPKVYMAKLPETDYQGVTARLQFEPTGELKNAATTLYSYKDGKKAAIE